MCTVHQTTLWTHVLSITFHVVNMRIITSSHTLALLPKIIKSQHALLTHTCFKSKHVLHFITQTYSVVCVPKTVSKMQCSIKTLLRKPVTYWRGSFSIVISHLLLAKSKLHLGCSIEVNIRDY